MKKHYGEYSLDYVAIHQAIQSSSTIFGDVTRQNVQNYINQVLQKSSAFNEALNAWKRQCEEDEDERERLEQERYNAEMLGLLRLFFDSHKHCHVPWNTSDSVDPKLKALSKWFHQVRSGCGFNRVVEGNIDFMSKVIVLNEAQHDAEALEIGMDLNPPGYHAKPRRVEISIVSDLQDLLEEAGIEYTALDSNFFDLVGWPKDSRPDAVIIFEWGGKMYFIIIEFDEHRHSGETVYDEQTRQIVLLLSAKNKCEKDDKPFGGLQFIRVNTAENRETHKEQLDNLFTLVKDAYEKIDKDTVSVSMTMLDYPDKHYHVTANQEHVLNENQTPPALTHLDDDGRIVVDFDKPYFTKEVKLEKTEGFWPGPGWKE